MGDKTTYTSVHVPRPYTSKSLCATDLTAAKPFAQQNKLITQGHLHGENARWSILYVMLPRSRLVILQMHVDSCRYSH